MAQPKPEALEPLPADPAKRIYYGEYYSPKEYAKCWEQWVKTNDPRGYQCDRYKERLEPFDPARRETFGEFYDPKKYHECRSRAEQRDTHCEYLKLRRREAREYWPYPNVPALKLPEAPNPPVYRWWMSAKQYFDALCKAEAGEFISRTVDNVEGVYQIRTRYPASTEAFRDRYVMEDPYGHTDAEARYAPQFFLSRHRYQYFEVPSLQRFQPEIRQGVVRYFGYDDRDSNSLKRESGPKMKSRYGYTWRGIKRPKDREHGIAGGELVVVDLETNEVLGIRRGFMLASKSQVSRSGLNWESGRVCPKLNDRPGWSKDVDFTVWFVTKVLRPMGRSAGGRNGEQRE
jgi:hypothetical protein